MKKMRRLIALTVIISVMFTIFSSALNVETINNAPEVEILQKVVSDDGVYEKEVSIIDGQYFFFERDGSDVTVATLTENGEVEIYKNNLDNNNMYKYETTGNLSTLNNQVESLDELNFTPIANPAVMTTSIAPASTSIVYDKLEDIHGPQYVGQFKYSRANNGVFCQVYETLTFNMIDVTNFTFYAGETLATVAASIAFPPAAVSAIVTSTVINGVKCLAEDIELTVYSTEAMYTQLANINDHTYYWAGKDFNYLIATSVLGSTDLHLTREYADPYFNDFVGLTDRAFENYFNQ